MSSQFMILQKFNICRLEEINGMLLLGLKRASNIPRYCRRFYLYVSFNILRCKQLCVIYRNRKAYPTTCQFKNQVKYF